MDRWRSSLAAALLLATLFSGTATAGDEDYDFHVEADPAQRLFQLSAFAHGYIHGYDEGFSIADMDIYFSRDSRDVEQHPSYKDGFVGYRGPFGNRASYQHGVRRGMLAGYADGISGRPYAAVAGTRAVADAIAVPLIVSDAEIGLFDLSFASGYENGLRFTGDLEREEDTCTTTATDVREVISRDGYCRGFRMGHADGLRTRGPEMRAQKD